MPDQQTWRYCRKCGVMFFDGFPDKGRCAAGDAHEAAGFEFVLSHDEPPADRQDQWRYCTKCSSLFFDGFPEKGACPSGDGHAAEGYDFCLPHDLPGTGDTQTAWRFCHKCSALFYDGFPEKGQCAAGAGHEAAGYDFVLAYLPAPPAALPSPTPQPPPAPPPFETNHVQAFWRYCGKCAALFFDGFPEKGPCSLGGSHEAVGYTFNLTHDLPETPLTQEHWRYCRKCSTMFFDGYPDKGQCAAGGSHDAAGFTFVLPHDVGGAPNAQVDWRYCHKCASMYFDGFTGKGSCPAGAGHEAAGFNFVLPHDIVAPFVFEAPIVSGGLAALGGWIRITLNLDGTVRWEGHAHNSGLDGYDFSISAVVRAPSGRAVAFAHSGHVGGTITAGSSDHDWSEIHALPAPIAGRLAEFTLGKLDTNLEYSSDIGSTLEATVAWLVKFGLGEALGPVGAIAFIAIEVGSLIDSGSLVPGARLAQGILWMAGPANTLFTIGAEGVAQLGSRERALHNEEYDWANEKVFGGALPPIDTIRLTDVLGGGGRPFTFPRFDGKITLNMGPSAFDNPRDYNGQTGTQWGFTFVHELVHACQIHHSSADLGYLADGLAVRICELSHDPYAYGAPGFDYTSLNIEQQAQIVSDWWAGRNSPTKTPADVESPYFRYITDNVRVGRF